MYFVGILVMGPDRLPQKLQTQGKSSRRSEFVDPSARLAQCCLQLIVTVTVSVALSAELTDAGVFRSM